MNTPPPTTLERVQAVVADHFGIEPTEVAPTASIIEDLGADSIDHVAIVMGLEEEFDVEIPEEVSNVTFTANAFAEWFDANSA